MSDWYCQVSGKVHGPYTPQQLKQLAQKQKLGPADQVRKGEDGTWMPATRANGLFPAAGHAAHSNSAQQPTQKKSIPQAQPLNAGAGAASANVPQAPAEPSEPSIFRNPLVMGCTAVAALAIVGIVSWEVVSLLRKPKAEQVAEANPTADQQSVDNQQAASSDANGTNKAVLAGETETAGTEDPAAYANVQAATETAGQTGITSVSPAGVGGAQEFTSGAYTKTTADELPGDASSSAVANSERSDSTLLLENAASGLPLSSTSPRTTKVSSTTVTKEDVLELASGAMVTLEIDRPGQKEPSTQAGFVLYPTGLIVAHSSRPLTNPQEITAKFMDGSIARVSQIVREVPEANGT